MWWVLRILAGLAESLARINLTSLLAKFVVQRRGVVCWILFGLTATTIQGFFVGTSPTDLFVRGDAEPSLKPPPAFLVIEAPDLFTAKRLAAVQAVVKATNAQPEIAKTLWLGDVPRMSMLGVASPLLPLQDIDAVQWEVVREDVLASPLAAGLFVSEDSQMMLVVLDYTAENPFELSTEEEFQSHYEKLVANARRAAALELTGGDLSGEKEIKAILADAELTVSMTGPAPLFFDNRRSMQANQIKFQIIGYALAGIIAALLFRGVLPIAIVGLAPFFSVIWSIGLLRLLNQPPNALTTPILPVLIAMVGLTDGVHLMTHIRRKRAEGLSPIQAARSAIREVGAACFLTSLTTAIGFGSLMLADSDFVQSFGLACAVAVSLTFVAVVTVIPLATTLPLAKNIHAGHENDLVGKGLHYFDWLIEAVLKHKRVTAIAGILLTIGLCGVSLYMQPDHSVNRAVPTWSPAKATLARVDKKMGGVSYARIFVKWNEGVSNTSPEIVKALQDVEKLVVGNSKFSKPLSMLNLLRMTPGGEETLSAKIGILNLAPKTELQRFVDRDRRVAYLTVAIQSTGIAQYQPIFLRIEKQLADLNEKYPDLTLRLGGDAVIHGRGLYSVVMNLVVSLGAASVIIFVIMTVVYRSLIIGLVTIVPNLFPLAATGALLVAFDWPLDISAVCAFTVCLGIAVDDTIHFLSRYQQELEKDKTHNVEAAIRRTFHKVGVALIMTTVVMVIGFATIITSDLPGQQTFGAMCCCTIAAALFGDMVILPALLAWFVRPPASR